MCRETGRSRTKFSLVPLILEDVRLNIVWQPFRTSDQEVRILIVGLIYESMISLWLIYGMYLLLIVRSQIGEDILYLVLLRIINIKILYKDYIGTEGFLTFMCLFTSLRALFIYIY